MEVVEEEEGGNVGRAGVDSANIYWEEVEVVAGAVAALVVVVEEEAAVPFAPSARSEERVSPSSSTGKFTRDSEADEGGEGIGGDTEWLASEWWWWK